jgi:hypothetical protein
MLVDTNGNLFIADSRNNRVVYWSVNATEGYIVAGTGAFGSWINLFKYAAAIVGEKIHRIEFKFKKRNVFYCSLE